MVTVIAIMLPIALITAFAEGLEDIWERIQDRKAKNYRSDVMRYV